jgi:hypothetical protein
MHWQRPAAFADDPEVEAEYGDLLERGSVTLDEVHRREQRQTAAPAFELRQAALVRRCAEEGLALRLVRSRSGWMEHERRRWRERRTFAAAGALDARSADPLATLEREAAELYETLQREQCAHFDRYSYSDHGLVPELLPESASALFLRNLEQLAARDGCAIAVERFDDFGETVYLDQKPLQLAEGREG